MSQLSLVSSFSLRSRWCTTQIHQCHHLFVKVLPFLSLRFGSACRLSCVQRSFRLDTDSNGRLSQEEWQKFFSRSDRDERGFLTPEDFQAAFSPAPPRPDPTNQPSRPPQMPPTTYWLNMLVNGELGSLSNGPNVGDPAPDFKLTTYQGDSEVALSSFKGTKPVVLIFGSFT